MTFSKPGELNASYQTETREGTWVVEGLMREKGIFAGNLGEEGAGGGIGFGGCLCDGNM